jgi:hypothetical protein
MTQKTRANADANLGCANQEISAVGTTNLHRYPEKITAEAIPTPEINRTSAIADLQHKFARLATATDPATAKAAIYDVLDSGWHTVDPRELIRAVEARLPKPSAAQLDAATLRRSKSTGQIITARALGALGDHVLILTADNPDGRPYYIRIATIPQQQPITAAAWDITRPRTRRTNTTIIDAEQQPAPAPTPTGRMIIC